MLGSNYWIPHSRFFVKYLLFTVIIKYELYILSCVFFFFGKLNIKTKVNKIKDVNKILIFQIFIFIPQGHILVLLLNRFRSITVKCSVIIKTLRGNYLDVIDI